MLFVVEFMKVHFFYFLFIYNHGNFGSKGLAKHVDPPAFGLKMFCFPTSIIQVNKKLHFSNQSAALFDFLAPQLPHRNYVEEGLLNWINTVESF